ncbi:hypothetical protein TNCV_3657171 [Trichonephila clavipes]|nr:hypothetical protein TNCV_3657171 [Trichonephila clavipes]
MEGKKEKNRFSLQFFFDKGQNASQVTEIDNGVYGVDTVTTSYVHTCRLVIENFDKISEIIYVDRHVSSRSITQELKIEHKTVLSNLRKLDSKRSSMFGCHTN